MADVPMFARAAIVRKTSKEETPTCDASTQRMIREGQHANEVDNANGTATGGGGVSDPTSKGRLPRQKGST